VTDLGIGLGVLVIRRGHSDQNIPSTHRAKNTGNGLTVPRRKNALACLQTFKKKCPKLINKISTLKGVKHLG
jgi:hypothetical protein